MGFTILSWILGTCFCVIAVGATVGLCYMGYNGVRDEIEQQKRNRKLGL